MTTHPLVTKNNPALGLSVTIAVHVLLVLLVVLKLHPALPPRPPEPVPVQLIKDPPAPKAELKPAVVTVTLLHQPVPVMTVPTLKVAEKPVEMPKVEHSSTAITLPAPTPPPAATPHPKDQKLDFEGRLMAHLNGLKRYPADAKRQGKTGVVMVRFRIDRKGHVLEYKIEQGSGHVILDEETARLMQRADPCPPPPETVPGAELEFVVPVQYKLG